MYSPPCIDKQISDHLKNADHHERMGRLHQALRSLDLAYGKLRNSRGHGEETAEIAIRIRRIRSEIK